MKRILKASAAFALATTLIFSGAGMASATDEATPAPEVSAEAQVTPTEAPAVEEAVVTEQVTAPAPAEAVETPEVTPAPAEPQAEVQTTDAQPQAPPVAAKTAPQKTSVCTSHGVSDGVTPYSVTKDGITLPAGCFFEDNGHVNIKTSAGPKGIHFESRNNQPSGQWIGQSFLPWSAFGLSGDFCVSWVQMSAFNEHFGEGGQKPVCTNPPFEVKEVCATWETKSVSKDWPQTILSKDCGFVPEQRCEPYKIQFDKYWIRDAADQAYFDSLKGLNSSADDQSLEPHDYYLKVIPAKDCTPALIEIPYPTMLANEVCGAQNDPVFTDPEWVKQYGSLVNGPWIDTKYKNQNGKWVVDGSAQIKPEFRKTHIWAGTAGTDKSSFLRWQMYPGTAPFVHEDTATVCPPVEVPANPKADITAICGAADITLTNPQKDGEANKTASFVVEVDGTFYGAYAVEPNKSETVKLTFPEDSGDHKVEVFQAGTSEWKSIAKETVKSDCIPPKPETKVEFSEWVDGEYECTATEVPQTRTKSVTTYELVDNKWVAQAPVITTETQTRPLTAEEQEAADIECAGPQPENKVTYTEWKTGEFVCGDTTVQITRTETVTEYVREGAEWVEGESVDNFQTETRALTEEELASLECAVPPVETCADFESQEDAQAAFDSDPVKYAGLDGDKDGIACETVVPPTTPTPVTPAPVTETGDLAQTGGAFPWTLAGLAALLVAGGAVLAKRRQA
ncbi:hypothetical protein SEA_A3WALLY_278 [Microbacterium phage A3Wally]|nr:hypothetical protein SEA_A3WALLY_278 [Microbacterium phage A3Wally]